MLHALFESVMRPSQQRGAALLMAMVIVTLVATFSACLDGVAAGVPFKLKRPNGVRSPVGVGADRGVGLGALDPPGGQTQWVGPITWGGAIPLAEARLSKLPGDRQGQLR